MILPYRFGLDGFAMQSFLQRLPFFRPNSTQPIMPPELRRHAPHFYGDIAWYGLLAGSTIAFLNVYAARIGATAFQIGMLTAGPAAINLLFTLPAGRWLRYRPVGNAVFWTAACARTLFLIYALLPLTLPESAQIQVMIWATLLLTVPGVALAIGFNALFAAAVPIEWRGQVVGRRNALERWKDCLPDVVGAPSSGDLPALPALFLAP